MQLPVNKSIIISVLSFCASVILLIYPALINGYPLVYPDTGTYIAAGFTNEVPIDRPLMYAIFVRHISMAHSLWFVIVMQAIIVVTVLLAAVRYLVNARYPFLVTLGIVAFLSLCTGISNYTSQVMPDIFSAVAILCLGLLIAVPGMSRPARAWMILLLIFSNMAHSSNLLSLTLVVGLLALLYRVMIKKLDIKPKTILLALSLIIASWLVIPAFNYSLGAGFKVSRAPNIFIMGRLIESGVLKSYLDDKCSAEPIPLCKFADSLPSVSWHFLWLPESPLYDGPCTTEWTSCWKEKNEEYAPVIREIFTTPRYLQQYAVFAAKESGKQLLDYNMAPLVPMVEGSPVYGVVHWHFRNELDQYMAASQAEAAFTAERTNLVQGYVVPASLLCYIAFMIAGPIRRKISRSLKIVSFVAIAGIVFNAVVCATFSMVAERFQARVIWLLPMIVALMIAYLVKEKYAGRTLSDRSSH